MLLGQRTRAPWDGVEPADKSCFGGLWTIGHELHWMVVGH